MSTTTTLTQSLRPRSLDGSIRTSDLLQVTLMTMLAAWIRLYSIGDKGLWYDEAATAVMARAALSEIIEFHWLAGFEHPPLWILTMNLWARVFGQSETALRLIPAFAGVLTIPLLWLLLRTTWRSDLAIRQIATGLVALSPILIQYSQESRMYSIVVMLAIASVYATSRLMIRPRWRILLAFVLVNWMMLGFHYYSVLLLGAEALFVVITAIPKRRVEAKIALGLVISILPMVLWISFSPGFQATAGVVLQEASGTEVPWLPLMDKVWKDLSSGNTSPWAGRWVWPTQQTALSYLMLPALLIGLFVATRYRSPRSSTLSPEALAWGRLFAIILIIPVIVSLLFPNRIITRYFLFVSPFFYTILALGITRLWRTARILGAAGLLITVLVSVIGLNYYFPIYVKSEYREMTAYLVSRLESTDGILIEAPRQHLLAKYYIPADLTIHPVPEVQLPDYWPVTVPPVVPENVDGQVKTLLKQYDSLWLILAGEIEVDPGHFLEKYLMAVSYRTDCRDSLDVRLCHFISPEAASERLSTHPNITFSGELQLRTADISLYDTKHDDHYLLLALHWRAESSPTVDYKVTLRLLDAAGNAQTQRDSLPIGPLLPPTTWKSGDDMTGYMALKIPDNLQIGDYDIVVGLYDPNTLAPFPISETSERREWLLPLAYMSVGETGSLTVYAAH